MGPAPAIEALAGLTFNRVAFAADMAMFDFGPLHSKIIGYGPRKGATIFVGSHALHVQCCWQVEQAGQVIADFEGALVPGALAPVEGMVVDSVVMTHGVIEIEIGAFKLTVWPRADHSGEQWRLLGAKPEDDHLVWGGEFGAQG
ncbi:hypothetical protein DevBK_06170 [Devosia sp. BK]|uniref:hypothetical protein n=1 Tax=unclassified Devosia TaxID=196773 RepID=UPI000715D3DA|nr:MULTISPECIES: hypothetical protein [unclassified Devosia]KQT51406.1 hypothetical protein ASG47_00425 [Devosia sp. Leaf420]MDV3250913.1 hypothetical protein [Devosia sp. BK]